MESGEGYVEGGEGDVWRVGREMRGGWGERRCVERWGGCVEGESGKRLSLLSGSLSDGGSGDYSGKWKPLLKINTVLEESNLNLTI